MDENNNGNQHQHHHHETKRIQEFVFVNENDSKLRTNQLIITKEACSPAPLRPATPEEETGISAMVNTLLPPVKSRAHRDANDHQ